MTSTGFFSTRARVGVWLSAVGRAGAAEARASVRTIEDAGYDTLWIGEGPQNKDVFANAAILLAATSSLAVATGVANIYARDAAAARTGSLALGDAFPGRFLFGIGVSHAPLVNDRGHTYESPLTVMTHYLDAMDAVIYRPPAPSEPVPVMLAALRPKMLELARARTAGAHTYFVPVEHTRRARSVIGPSSSLVPELMVAVDEDPVSARAKARKAMKTYLALPNYTNNLRDLGYADADFADGGSDRLVDDLVAWGTTDVIVERVREHLEAGADQVAIQPVGTDLARAVNDLEKLAPTLLAI